MTLVKQCIILLSLTKVFLAAPLEAEWQLWKQQHGKVYKDDEQELLRSAIWTKNYQYIEKHNRENHPFKLGLNEFADMTHEEFKEVYLQQQVAYPEQDEHTQIHEVAINVTIPSSIDWRMKGFVSNVKSQGRCSSSWAFSATGVLEGQLYKATRKLVSLSEQQLLDCSGKFGNKGCYGGVPYNAFKYASKAGGICAESRYPYLGYVYYCADDHCSKVFGCTKSARIQSGCESCLLDASYYIGPISVAVDASSISFQYYTSGIYSDTDCNRSNLNHAMLVVGYGTDYSTGVDYWILKNSWGQSWGLKGYMYLARNQHNMCGIATAASYAKL